MVTKRLHTVHKVLPLYKYQEYIMKIYTLVNTNSKYLSGMRRMRGMCLPVLGQLTTDNVTPDGHAGPFTYCMNILLDK